ncbi:hypothetical protein [Brevibacterium linens]|nr:hypothetical protein [Brevibacterium linens]
MTQTPVTAPSTQDPPQRLLSGKKRVLASALPGRRSSGTTSTSTAPPQP